MSHYLGFILRACALVLILSGICHAQTGYGVNSSGSLFSFDLNAPGPIPITTIGNLGFVPEGIDIYTVPGDTDPTIGGDSGYAVFTRSDVRAAPFYMLYQVNLATGATTNGRVVGTIQSPADFTGGFAIAPGVVPEPTALALLTVGLVAAIPHRRRAVNNVKSAPKSRITYPVT